VREIDLCQWGSSAASRHIASTKGCPFSSSSTPAGVLGHEANAMPPNNRVRWSSVLWAWAAFAIAEFGCAHSTPVETSPVKGTSRPPTLSVEKRYAGTYVYAGGDAERAAVKTAVDSATEGMGIATGFARSALMKRSEIRPTYTIGFDQKGNVSVETPGYPPEFSPTSGTEVKQTNKYGDESESSQPSSEARCCSRAGRTTGAVQRTLSCSPTARRCS
jgi:hypothetical protein